RKKRTSLRSKEPPEKLGTCGDANGRNVRTQTMRASDQGKKQLPISTVQYLTFLTAGEEYAIAIVKIREIIEYEAVTTVPNTPVWIRGVTNLRGKVVPVVDLAVKFGMPAAGISKFSCIIITEVMFQGESLIMGVLADAVSQVIELSADEIEATPPFGTRVKTEYLLGMGALGKKFCLILDIDKVLSADEVLAVSESAASEETSDAAVINAPAKPANRIGTGA
ncbi:MAG: chemotaxis protein CheW, partial [Candidatus Sulfotelmatobacter sp.]